MAKKIDYSALVQILERYFTKDELADFLEQAKLKKSGNKIELIERLLNESNYDISYLLSKLHRDDLIEICEEFDIPKKRTKQEMVDEITGRIDMKKRTKTKDSKKAIQAPEIEEVYSALKDFKPYKIRDEAELEKQIFQWLEGRGIKGVTAQTAGAYRGDIHIPDIVVGNSTAIEIKYFSRQARDNWDKAVGQAIRYKANGNYDWIILFTLDESGIVPEDYKKYEELLPWLKIIVKK